MQAANRSPIVAFTTHHTQFLDDDDIRPKFVCAHCRYGVPNWHRPRFHQRIHTSCEVAEEQSVVWEGFMGSAQNPAYLFKSAINVEPCSSRPREELLSTGGYVLVDVHCRGCSTVLGWQYIAAKSQDQKYKEGATLLQQGLLRRLPVIQAPRSATTPINAATHQGAMQHARATAGDVSRHAEELLHSLHADLQRAVNDARATVQLPVAARC